MIKIIIILIILLITCCEIDRNAYMYKSIFDFYYRSFPNDILYGIHNSIYKIYNSKMIFDPTNMIFNKYLVKNKSKILDEYLKVENTNIEIYAHNHSSQLKKDFNYKYIFLKLGRKLFTDNLKHFPTIETFLKKHNNIKTCFFSIMNKRKIIPYHMGPSNSILRYHLPIIMSNPKECYIEVMGKKLFYDKPFLFDDTYPHKLQKNDDSKRVVLIIDIDNPHSFFHIHKYI